MSQSVLAQVQEIATGAARTAEQAMPIIAAIAAQAHGATTDHETRLQKLEALIAQWAPLIAATASVVEKTVEKPAEEPKP